MELQLGTQAMSSCSAVTPMHTHTRSQILFKADLVALLYVKQMCEIQIRTTAMPTTLANQVNVKCKT